MTSYSLKEAAEKAKIELSSRQETSVNLPFITVGPGSPVHLDMRLSRAKLEQMISPLIERSMDRPSAPSPSRFAAIHARRDVEGRPASSRISLGRSDRVHQGRRRVSPPWRPSRRGPRDCCRDRRAAAGPSPKLRP